MKRLSLSAILSILLCVGLPALSAPPKADQLAYRFSDTPDVLKGIKSVFIYIDPIGPDFDDTGITDRLIRSDVELKLRQTGIRVLVLGKDSVSAPSGVSPGLTITVTGLKDHNGSGTVTYNVDVSLRDDVLSTRAKNTIIVQAKVWETTTVGYAGLLRYDAIRESVKDMVDRFLNAYLTANPKQ